MNYFQFHLNDYAEATAHLTFVEDAAYVRLLRKYYAQEGPFKDEMKAIFRLVGARTEEEKEAIQTVLSEFFTLADGCWIHERCDIEIACFQEKRDKASGAAKTRWERARIAEALRLESERNANASESDANAQKSDADAMHTQEPITNNQEPIKNTVSGASASVEEKPPDQTGKQSPGRLTAVMKSHGIAGNPGSPRLIALAQSGLTLESMEAACVEARLGREGERLTQNYVYAILERWAQEAAQAKQRPSAAGPPKRPGNPKTIDINTFRNAVTKRDDGAIEVQAREIPNREQLP